MTEAPVMTTTRDIARAAVRDRLARVAVELFRREGFDKVTASEVAAAAGVSRSTFLRYFGTKEEAVLSAFETNCDDAVTMLRARPAGEDDWTVLRHGMGAFVQPYYENATDSLALARLIGESAALRARRLEMMFHWRNILAGVLAERAGRSGEADIRYLVLTAAAMDCLNIAVEQWTDMDGRVNLTDLLDQAFATLAPRDPGAVRE
ncbi:TetR family transcriptional regulator [Streptomyces sp. JW3]|uniref:TetR family transcriptional regulator n=1 Tax=Streptomyces sp. JW3 TaxID=3456955 RepID=UPI003FA4817B